MWDNYIYVELLKRKIAIPPKKQNDKSEKYAGAYVKEPKPGIYDWVVSFDLNSLYPHLIMQYNIHQRRYWMRDIPATVDGFLKQEVTVDGEYAVKSNGAQYRKDIHGFLPEMMQKMYDSRVIFKKKMIAAKKEYEKNPSVELTNEISRCNNIHIKKIVLIVLMALSVTSIFVITARKCRSNHTVRATLYQVDREPHERVSK